MKRGVLMSRGRRMNAGNARLHMAARDSRTELDALADSFPHEARERLRPATTALAEAAPAERAEAEAELEHAVDALTARICPPNRKGRRALAALRGTRRDPRSVLSKAVARFSRPGGRP